MLLIHLFRISLESEIFPNKLKTARVVLLPKDGNPANITYFRPISFLPYFSKKNGMINI